MASHISASPNHQTFRRIPLKYRIDVAMSGRLGMEIQPQDMTTEEKYKGTAFSSSDSGSRNREEEKAFDL